jgi:hypothetical protein
LTLLAPLGAQISPGPLSRPHQSLNGATNCTSCHKFGGQAVLKCLACHTEIAARLDARQGFLKKIGVGFGARDLTLEASKEAKLADASRKQLAQAAAPAH